MQQPGGYGYNTASNTAQGTPSATAAADSYYQNNSNHHQQQYQYDDQQQYHQYGGISNNTSGSTNNNNNTTAANSYYSYGDANNNSNGGVGGYGYHGGSTGGGGESNAAAAAYSQGYNNTSNNNNNTNAAAAPVSGGYAPQQQQQYQQQQYQATPMHQPQHQQQQYQPSTAASASAASQPDPTLRAPQQTDSNGMRWTWTTYPTIEYTKDMEKGTVASIPLPPLVVPLACMYTPLHPLPQSAIVYGDPSKLGMTCANCGAFCCMHSRIDVAGSYWTCNSCLRRRSLSQQFELTHPALSYPTVEFILPDPVAPMPVTLSAPVFMYIIDINLAFQELEVVKKNVIDSLQWLPFNAYVGIISFGREVKIHEPGCLHFDKSVSLRGERAYTPDEWKTMLQVNDNAHVLDRYVVHVGRNMDKLSGIIQRLRTSPFLVPPSDRPLRATGTAVEGAVSLLEMLYSTKPRGGAKAMTAALTAAKIVLLTGGPCTRGSGAVVGVLKEEMMRFHRDIIDGNTPHYVAAVKFYGDLKKRMLELNTCFDVYTMSYDQVGIMEMREAVDDTGGTFICADQFDHPIFVNSFARAFERSGLMRGGRNGPSSAQDPAEPSLGQERAGFGVHLEVHTSEDTLVCGALGPCNVDVKSNKQKPGRTASPLQIGVGGTTRWNVSFLDQTTTIAFIFDTATLGGGAGSSGGGGGVTSLFSRGTANTSSSSTGANTTNSSQQQQQQQQQVGGRDIGHSQKRFFQFVTRYQTLDGQVRIRVTSISQPIAPMNPTHLVLNEAFDQACAATVLARMCVSILEKYPKKWEETKRWLDSMLVRFVRTFGTFSPGSPDSVRLSSSVSLFPSFIFNLRRSEYFMVLNISPDETTFKRHWLMRENCDTCVLMIQPTLDSYTINEPYACPVPLDSTSLKQDNILLMDAFFNVHIMWGTAIYEWMKLDYHKNPDFAYFAELLQTVDSDAEATLAGRFPYPRFSRTDADGSEARHIKTRMNPATTHHQQSGGGGYAAASGTTDGSDIIYTDDASISKFMASLKVAVTAVETTKS